MLVHCICLSDGWVSGMIKLGSVPFDFRDVRHNHSNLTLNQPYTASGHFEIKFKPNSSDKDLRLWFVYILADWQAIPCFSSGTSEPPPSVNVLTCF